MNIIGYKKIYFSISGVLVVSSILGIMIWGLNLGIDFTGGSLLEVNYLGDRPKIEEIQDKLAVLDLGETSIQPIGEKGMLFRFKDVSEEVHQKILVILNEDELEYSVAKENSADNNKEKELLASLDPPLSVGIVEKRFDSIGPIIGQELKTKTIYAIFIALIMIILFISWAFRKVYKPISSWKYGVISIVALFHDILIVLGVFVFLGKFYDIEVNASFVAALLTILGYSVNDTIVIFDRIRENLKHYDYHFDNTVNKSVNQNLVRSVYTSLTTLLVLLSLYFFGGETIKSFVFALIIGVVVGTYSSIFLASPLLVVWEKSKRK